MISARGLRKSYGALRGGQGHRRRGARGRGVRLPRAQRRRQVVDHADDRGRLAGDGGARLSILGMDPATQGSEIRARIGVCPQEDSLDGELRVKENLVVYGRYFGLSRREASDAGRRAALVRPAVREGRRPGRGALRRDEAPADHRAVADQPARPAAARRADDRSRPAGTPPALGPAVPAQAAGRDPGAHHPLHGRGRAAVRPARGHGQGADRRGRLARRADRRALHAARCSSSASGRARTRRWRRRSATSPSRVEVLPDRLLLYTDDGEAAAVAVHDRRLTPVSSLIRRSTLEDVFLRLTGRTLVD